MVGRHGRGVQQQQRHVRQGSQSDTRVSPPRRAVAGRVAPRRHERLLGGRPGASAREAGRGPSGLVHALPSSGRSAGAGGAGGGAGLRSGASAAVVLVRSCRYVSLGAQSSLASRRQVGTGDVPVARHRVQGGQGGRPRPVQAGSRARAAGAKNFFAQMSSISDKFPIRRQRNSILGKEGLARGSGSGTSGWAQRRGEATSCRASC